MSIIITEAAWNAASKEPYEKWAPILHEHMFANGINTKERIAMFLAQASHESGGFSRLVENLNYSAEGLAKTWPGRYASGGKPNDLAKKIARNPEMIANYTYANRMGNGGPESGDGWKYRGRGIFQLTGKANYQSFFYSVGLRPEPEKLAEPELAIMSACWFWVNRKLNDAADAKDVAKATKIINGGSIGLEHRTKLYNQILRAL